MKNIFFVVGILLGINAYVYSLDSQAWMSFGFEFSNFFETHSENGNARKTVNSYIGIPGLHIHGYRFFNDSNLGVFVHGLYFGLPVANNQNINFNNCFSNPSK